MSNCYNGYIINNNHNKTTNLAKLVDHVDHEEAGLGADQGRDQATVVFPAQYMQNDIELFGTFKSDVFPSLFQFIFISH